MLGLKHVACRPSFILVLTIFFPTPIVSRLIPHFSNNGSLFTKEVAGGWGRGRGPVG